MINIVFIELLCEYACNFLSTGFIVIHSHPNYQPFHVCPRVRLAMLHSNNVVCIFWKYLWVKKCMEIYTILFKHWKLLFKIHNQTALGILDKVIWVKFCLFAFPFSFALIIILTNMWKTPTIENLSYFPSIIRYVRAHIYVLFFYFLYLFIYLFLITYYCQK